MTLVVDAGPLIAVFGLTDPRRGAILGVLLDEPGGLIIPPPVTAEVDYFVGRRYGESIRRKFIGDLAAGRFVVPHLEREDYATIAELDVRYADFDLGLADCSLVVLAHRYRTARLLTFDERHFRTVSTLDGRPFELLPADGPGRIATGDVTSQ